MTQDDVSPWYARGLYLFGIALIVTSAIDLFTTVWPMRPGDVAWRYGFLGLGAGYLQTPTLGLVLVAGTALWQKNRAVLRFAGVAGLLGALSLFLAMGMFGLDVMTMRAIRAEDARSAVLAGGMFQEVKYFMAAFVLAFLGFGALKTAKDIVSDPREGRPPGIVSSTG